MTDVWLIKTPNGFEYSGEEDAELCKRIKVGDVVKGDITKPRHGKHHRKGMKILRYVFDNQDKYDTFPNFLKEVKIATGHVDTHITSDGQIIYILKSISFEQMDELEFTQWKKDAVKVIFSRFIPELVEHEVDEVVENIIAML